MIGSVRNRRRPAAAHVFVPTAALRAAAPYFSWIGRLELVSVLCLTLLVSCVNEYMERSVLYLSRQIYDHAARCRWKACSRRSPMRRGSGSSGCS